MSPIEKLLYDLRHPITLVQRTMGRRYCKRFGMRMVEGPFVRLWSAEMEPVATVVPQRYKRSDA